MATEEIQPRTKKQQTGDMARLAGRIAGSKPAIAAYTFKATAGLYAAAESHLEGAGEAFLLAVQDIIPVIPGI